jgi:hypothetical protein
MATTTKAAAKAKTAQVKMRAIKPARLTKEYDGTIKVWYRITDLKLDPENAREHDDRNLTAIGDSIEQFEQQKPVVIDADGIVRAGNGLCLELMRRGDKEVWGVRMPLRGAQAKAYALADNRTAELSRWNFEQVQKILVSLKEEGADYTKLGWADYELDPIMAAQWQPPAQEPMAEGEGGLAPKAAVISFSPEQFEVVRRAIAMYANDQAEEPSEGASLMAICAMWMGGRDG